MSTVERMLTYAALGAALGGAAGFLLPPLREPPRDTVGMGVFLHLGLLGVLLAIPGPAIDLGFTGVLAWLGKRTVRLVEVVTFRNKPPLPLIIEERKMSAAIVAGAITVAVLALGVLWLAQLNLSGWWEVATFALAFALFPVVLTIVDCVVDHVYRAIVFESIFAAMGGLLGLAAAFACWIVITGSREQLAAGAAAYGGLAWLFVGLGKTVEEREEAMEAREDAEEAAEEAEGETCALATEPSAERPEQQPGAEAAPPSPEEPASEEPKGAGDKPST